MSKFQTGDLVLAKMKFCPPWPAKIDNDPKGQTKKKQYYITFFGTNDHAWIQEKDIARYDGTLEPKGANPRAGLNEAIAEINAAYAQQSEAHRDLDEIRKHREGHSRSQSEKDESQTEAKDDGSADQKTADAADKRKSKATPKKGRQSVAAAKREKTAPLSQKENGSAKRRTRKTEPEAEEVVASAQRSSKRKLDSSVASTEAKRTKIQPESGDAKRDAEEGHVAEFTRFSYSKQCSVAAQRLVGTFDLHTAKVHVLTDCQLAALPSEWRLLLSTMLHKLSITMEYTKVDSATSISDRSNLVGAAFGAPWHERLSMASVDQLLTTNNGENAAQNELIVLAFERAELLEQLIHRDTAALRLLAQRLAGSLVLLLTSTQLHPSLVVELCEAVVKSSVDATADAAATVQVPTFVELSFVERDRLALAEKQVDATDSLALLAGDSCMASAIEKTLRDAQVCKAVNVGPELGSAFYFTLALRAVQTAAVVSAAESFAVLEKSSIDRSAYREVLEHSSLRCDTLLRTVDVLASQNFSSPSSYVLDAARRDLAMFRQVAHAHSASAAMTTACAELIKRVDARRRDKDGREDVSVVYKAIVQP